MAYAAQPCGPSINDPSLPTLCDLGYLWQWQKVDGQLPRWVAIQRIDEPVAQLGRLGVCTAPQRPSAMLPLAMPPRGSVAFCTTPKAMPLSEPRPKKMPKGPVPPPGPPPKHLMHQQALQEGPGQPQVHSHVFESLNQWQQQLIALTQQQTSLHHRAMDMQHEAMNQMHQEHVYKKQKRQHMPQQQVAMKEQQPMSTQVEKPLPLQQDVVQEQLGSTMPVPIGLGLQSSDGQGAGSGSGAAYSGSGAHYSGSGAAYSASAGAALGSAGEGSVIRPSVTPCHPERCPGQWPKLFNALKDDVVAALIYFKNCLKCATDPQKQKDD